MHKITQSIGTSNTCNRKQYRLSYDKYSFVRILQNHFNLHPFIAERMIWILTQLSRNRLITVKSECACLAVMLFVTNESKYECYEDLDITDFVFCLYKQPEECKQKMIQIYGFLENVQAMFGEIQCLEKLKVMLVSMKK